MEAQSVVTFKARELPRKAGSHSFLCTSISHVTVVEYLCNVCISIMPVPSTVAPEKDLP